MKESHHHHQIWCPKNLLEQQKNEVVDDGGSVSHANNIYTDIMSSGLEFPGSSRSS